MSLGNRRKSPASSSFNRGRKTKSNMCDPNSERCGCTGHGAYTQEEANQWCFDMHGTGMGAAEGELCCNLVNEVCDWCNWVKKRAAGDTAYRRGGRIRRRR